MARRRGRGQQRGNQRGWQNQGRGPDAERWQGSQQDRSEALRGPSWRGYRDEEVDREQLRREMGGYVPENVYSPARAQGGWSGARGAGEAPGRSEPDYGGEWGRLGGLSDREATRGPYSGRGPRGYQRASERLYEDVCERLTDAGDLDASNIEVRADGDEVTLEGTVSDRHAKRRAEDLAESVRGVRDVHNRLRVSGRGEPTGIEEQL